MQRVVCFCISNLRLILIILVIQQIYCKYKCQNYQTIMQLASSSLGSQVYVPENRLGYPQRRKMYNLNDRHNLSSSIDLAWVNSLESKQIKNNKTIEEKRHNGSDRLVEQYNRYVDRQLASRYLNDKFATIPNNDTIESSPKPNKSTSRGSRKDERVNFDESLNHQIENFIGKHETNRKKSFDSSHSATINPQIASNRNPYNPNPNQFIYKQQAHTLSPRFLKQLVLRSALDPPEVYSQINSPDYSTIRNIKPDTLQNYLRPEKKRYY